MINNAFVAIQLRKNIRLSIFMLTMVPLCLSQHICFGQGQNRLLIDLNPEQMAQEPLGYGIGSAFPFRDYTLVSTNDGLFRSDGTREGTFFLNNTDAGRSISLTYDTDDGKGYFATDKEVYITDGTVDGTRRIDSNIGSLTPLWIKKVNGNILLGSFWGGKLWQLNGDQFTAFKDISAAGIRGASFYLNGDLFFLSHIDGVGLDIWKTDGTVSGTVAITDGFQGRIYALGSFKSEIFFISSKDGSSFLWKLGSGGTYELVTELGAYVPTIREGVSIFQSDDQVWIAMNTNPNIQLWRSDLTAAGTQHIGEISDAGWSLPDRIVARGDTAIVKIDRRFYGFTGDHRQLLMENNLSTSTTIKTFGNSFLMYEYGKLYVTDGTSLGTQRIGDITSGHAVIGDKFVFIDASGGGNGRLRIIEDGSITDVAMLTSGRGIVKGPFGEDSAIYIDTGSEIWKSDLTPSGTNLFRSSVYDISVVKLGGRVFILTDEFFRQFDEIFRSYIMEDLISGEKNVVGMYSHDAPFYIRPQIADRLMFLGRGWVTDGKASVPLLQKRTDLSFQRVTFYGKLGEKMLLAAWTADKGYKLWSTDGTAAGTGEFDSSVVDFDVYPPDLLYRKNDSIHYYFMNTPGNGREIVRIDLARGNKLSVYDYSPGIYSSPFYRHPYYTKLQPFSSQSNDFFSFYWFYYNQPALQQASMQTVRASGTDLSSFYPRQHVGTSYQAVKQLSKNRIALIVGGSVDIFDCITEEVEKGVDDRVCLAHEKDGYLYARYGGTVSDALARIDSAGNKEILLNGLSSDSYTFSFYDAGRYLYWLDDEKLHRYNVEAKTKEEIAGGETLRKDTQRITRHEDKLLVFGNDSLFSIGDIKASIAAIDGTVQYFSAKGFIYFFVYKSDVTQLWRTDGTKENTVLVTELQLGGNVSVSGLNVRIAAGGFYFYSWVQPHPIWYSDGTSDGTFEIPNTGGNAYGFPFNEDFLYAAGSKLWIYDLEGKPEIQIRNNSHLVHSNSTTTFFDPQPIRLEIRNEGSAPLTISGVDLPAWAQLHDVNFPITIPIASSITITATLADDPETNPFPVVIHSDDPHTPAYTVLINVVQPVAIEDWSVYPNPASSHIEFNVPDYKDACILDRLGRPIAFIEQNERSLDVSGLAPGIYLIKVNFGSVIVTRKFVISK
jgi:ELWxxDGT repeat protein